MVKEMLIHSIRPSEFRALLQLRRSDFYIKPEKIDLKKSALEDEDLIFCYKSLAKVSRSFAVVIMHLPSGLKEAVSVFYLVCRALDTIEDDTELNKSLKIDLLRQFYKLKSEDAHILRGIGDKPDYRVLVNHYDKVLRCLSELDEKYRKVILEVARKMGKGMAEFVEKPISTKADYDLYCHYVAGLVGIGLTDLFEKSGFERPNPHRNSETSNAMGLFLQKTNIIRDFLEDAISRRFFWPEEVWKKYGSHLIDLRDLPQEKKLECLDELIADALSHVPDCLRYLSTLKNQKIFRFCAIPQVMAVATLTELLGNNKLYDAEVKIRKGMAARFMLETNNFPFVCQVFYDSVKLMEEKKEERVTWPLIQNELDQIAALTMPQGPQKLALWLEAEQAQQKTKDEDDLFDVVVVGAGLTGCAAAISLARIGWRVALIEKNKHVPERIIGELMQPGGIELLETLGLAEALDDIDAQEIQGYSIIYEKEDVQIPYPNNKKGRAFHHKLFLENLRKMAEDNPKIQMIFGEAEKIILDESQSVAKGVWVNINGKSIALESRLILFADGPFSRFRQQISSKKPLTTGYFLGLILKNAILPHSYYGHVIINEGHTCLVYPISSNETRILIDFPSTHVPKPGAALIDYLKKNLQTLLPSKLQDSFAAALESGDLKIMPNHRINHRKLKLEGVCLLGDALNMRHPLTGGGMTAALTDVKALLNILKQLSLEKISQKDLTDALRKFFGEEHNKNSSINILADALYLTVKNPLLRRACLDYLKQGGKRAQEPMAILSALSRSRRLLIYHFFKVTVEGAFNQIRNNKFQGIKSASRMILDSFRIIGPLLRQEMV